MAKKTEQMRQADRLMDRLALFGLGFLLVISLSVALVDSMPKIVFFLFFAVATTMFLALGSRIAWLDHQDGVGRWGHVAGNKFSRKDKPRLYAAYMGMNAVLITIMIAVALTLWVMSVVEMIAWIDGGEPGRYMAVGKEEGLGQ